MDAFEIVFLLTSPILSLTIYKCFHALLNQQVKNPKVELFTYLLHNIFGNIIFLTTRVPMYSLIYITVTLYLLSFNYRSILSKRILYVMFVYTHLTLVDMIFNALFKSIFPNGEHNLLMTLIFVRIITLTISFLAHRYKTYSSQSILISKSYYVCVMLILVGTVFLFLGYLSETEDFLHILIGAVFVIAINISIIFLYEKVCKSFILFNEKNLLQQQMIAYENQLEIINQSMNTINLMKHDMKNHIFALQNLYENDSNKASNYATQILSTLDDNMIYSKSCNVAFDSIINFKLHELEDELIQINVTVDAPNQLNISPYDITVILGNLLDNAITALKTPHENKCLDLKIKCSKGKLMIFMDNTFDGTLLLERGKLKSTKNDHNGLGLINIYKSLENYNGYLTTEYIQNRFLVTVLIPYL